MVADVRRHTATVTVSPGPTRTWPGAATGIRDGSCEGPKVRGGRHAGGPGRRCIGGLTGRASGKYKGNQLYMPCHSMQHSGKQG